MSSERSITDLDNGVFFLPRKKFVSEAKTLGHYADKQSKKYGKWKCEDMKRDFKTKKVQGGAELPEGMSRMEKPDGGVKWTKDEPKKKRRKKKR